MTIASKVIKLRFIGVVVLRDVCQYLSIPNASRRSRKWWCIEKLSNNFREDEDGTDKAFAHCYNRHSLRNPFVLTPTPSSATITPTQQNGAMVPALTKKYDALRSEVSDVKGALQDTIENTLSVNAIEQMVKKHITPRKSEVIIRKGGFTTRIRGIFPKFFPRLLQLAEQRINTLLVGPSGCGKTHTAQQLAKALKLKFATCSCSAGMSESQLAGWILPIGEGCYISAPFADFFEKGGVFLLDELDSADPNTMTFINTALANNVMSIPQRAVSGLNPSIKRHKDFVCLAAANTFGHGGDFIYVGRNELDGATLDRFRVGMIVCDYDEHVERSLADPAVYDWGIQIREAIRQLDLRRILSTRVLIEFTKMKAACGWKASDFDEAYFADWTEDEKSRVISRRV